jgi:FkbM family methyltransferase
MIRSVVDRLKEAGRWGLDAEYRRKRRERQRLQEMDRYRPGLTSLLDQPVRFVDSASFLSAYRAIFEQEIYNFTPSNTPPVIIDGGANVGLATLYWTEQFPEANITGFEPDPQVFETLQWNVQRWEAGNVSLVQKGLWSEETTLEFASDGADAGHVSTEDDGADTTHEVPVTRLVPYLREPIDLLKLDIEGAEAEVLVDAAGHLGSVQNLFVEYHSYVGEEQRIDEILQVVRETGFRVHIQPELVANQPFVERLESHGMDHRLNIFAYRE